MVDTQALDTLRFRLAATADRPHVLALCAAYRAADHQPPAVERVRAAVDAALAGEPLIQLYLIEACTDGAAPAPYQLLGYVAITIGFSIEVGGRDAFVDELYVEEHARGLGIGTRALAFAEQRCRELDVRRVLLEVERENPRAKALYTRLGFHAHDRFLMSKLLG